MMIKNDFQIKVSLCVNEVVKSVLWLKAMVCIGRTFTDWSTVSLQNVTVAVHGTDGNSTSYCNSHFICTFKATCSSTLCRHNV